MCDDHSGVLVEIPSASFRGEHGRKRGIDACIAPLVDALNKAGVDTFASCCGHGERPGNIVLRDGREILIARNFDEGRMVDAILDNFYGVTVYGEPIPANTK